VYTVTFFGEENMRSKDVNAKKCPRLHAALVREETRARAGWTRVAELRRAGQDKSAARLVKRLLGVQGDPMPEERREYLAQYNLEHKEEIKERRHQEAEIRRRTIAMLTNVRRKR
jgi:hypothetical protein